MSEEEGGDGSDGRGEVGGGGGGGGGGESGSEGEVGGEGTEDADEQEWKSLQETMKVQQQKKKEKRSKESYPVHAPFFPDVGVLCAYMASSGMYLPPVQVKQEEWWLYIADRRRKEMVVFPQKVSGLKTVMTQDLQFHAPERPCVLRYSVVLTSDSYLNLTFAADLKVPTAGSGVMCVCVYCTLCSHPRLM